MDPLYTVPIDVEGCQVCSVLPKVNDDVQCSVTGLLNTVVSFGISSLC